ncbi:MAG: carboxypeptidase-like regulatory domain-containing protein, partial [Cyclobacteriaceae bacterium]|nr:carboxypeptidase-like regulatory domain-containing protein [Cyclobacteriaceae bacterium]
MKQSKFLFFLFLYIPAIVFAQQSDKVAHGKVIDSSQIPISNVYIIIEGTKSGTVTDQNGDFNLKIKRDDMEKSLIFRHIQYVEKEMAISSINFNNDRFVIILEDSLRILDQVNVTENRLDQINENVSTFNLNPINSQFVPAPFQDISSILITLPGVSSNNEFSTGYAVRGGNFDENLVYVNNIPVYRPQIITSGQQEGLSFINTDLVQGIEFSSGGWEAKYGDGLASTLNINYKKPRKFAGSLNAGLLGGSVHFEGISKNDKLTYLVGARHKSSTYLLNTLETKGEYRPRFTDIQTYINYDISKKGSKDKTEIGMLFSYAQNRYLVRPTSRETTFGTFNNQLRLFVAFDGQEKLTYDTWQGGIRLSHRLTSKWRSHLIISGTYSREREYYDIESGYLLCNVDTNPGSSGFNECMTNIGIGTNYYSGRNLLNATLLNIESRNEVIINNRNTMEFGIGYANHNFDDILNEYEFIDSADYVTITDAATSETKINYSRI